VFCNTEVTPFFFFHGNRDGSPIVTHRTKTHVGIESVLPHCRRHFLCGLLCRKVQEEFDQVFCIEIRTGFGEID